MGCLRESQRPSSHLSYFCALLIEHLTVVTSRVVFLGFFFGLSDSSVGFGLVGGGCGSSWQSHLLNARKEIPEKTGES